MSDAADDRALDDTVRPEDLGEEDPAIVEALADEDPDVEAPDVEGRE